MKTMNHLAKTMFKNILTAAFFAFAFTACSDEVAIDDENTGAPQTESSNLSNLEQYSYYVPIQVDIQGRWKAELKFENDDNHFCYLNRSEGIGPTYLKLCVLDNWTEERNYGQLLITDLESNTTQTYTLKQKCNLDNPDYMAALTRASDGDGEKKEEEAAPVKDKGDITTAVGYGYNVNMEPGVKAISSRPIIALELLRDAGNGYGPSFQKGEFKINVESYAGSSLMDISEQMSTSASLKCARSGFNAEAEVTFTNTQKSSTSNMYCLTIANVNVGQAVLRGIDRNNVRQYMTEDAKRAIDGTGTAYPSTNAGFKQLIEDYGSHLILTTDLGGRLRYGATIDKQFCSNTNELKAHASMGYKNKLMEANAKASEDYKSTYEQTKNHIVRTVSASGGGFKETAAVAADDKNDNVNAWVASLENEQSLAVINFNVRKSQQLWPLYDLIDTSTPEGKDRHDKLMAYIEDGTMENDFYVDTGQQSTLYLRSNRLFTVKPMGITEKAETRDMVLVGQKITPFPSTKSFPHRGSPFLLRPQI